MTQHLFGRRAPPVGERVSEPVTQVRELFCAQPRDHARPVVRVHQAEHHVARGVEVAPDEPPVDQGGHRAPGGLHVYGGGVREHGDRQRARRDAELALAGGDLDACSAALEVASAKVGAEQTDLRARVHATRAEHCYQRGSLDEAQAAARAAIASSREDDPIHTQARNALTKVFMWRGELDRGWDWTQENIARARGRGATTEVLRGVINLGVIAVRKGDLDEAARQYEAARAIAARGGTMMLRGVLRENEAVVAHLRGRFGDALSLYQEALGILIRVGHRQFLARVANNLGELYVQVGETARARRLCEYAAQVGRGLSRGVTAEGLLLRAQERARRVVGALEPAHEHEHGAHPAHRSEQAPDRFDEAHRALAVVVGVLRRARRDQGGERLEVTRRENLSLAARAQPRERLRSDGDEGREGGVRHAPPLEHGEARDAHAPARRYEAAASAARARDRAEGVPPAAAPVEASSAAARGGQAPLRREKPVPPA